MFEKWISWLFGYLDFYVYGKYPERFITLAARNGIRIWNMESGEKFSCRTSIEGYQRLRLYRRRCGVRMKIYRKHGLPFYFRKARKRSGLIIGFFVFAAVYGVLSSYIWSVDVEGNKGLRSEDILKAAQECGLETGTLKSRLDSNLLETQLMLQFPELGWISVNTYGCAVSLSVKERIEAPPILDTSQPTNLVASCPGQIIRLEIFGGESKVKVGDGVTKGQMLVSGVVLIGEKDISLKHAYGRVIAETHHELSVRVEKQQEETVPSGKEIYRCSARIFGIQVPLTFSSVPKGEYQREVWEEPFKIGGVVLPVSILKEKWSECSVETRRVNREEASAIGEKQLQEKFITEYPKAEILSKETKMAEEKDHYIITWTVVCEEDIAEQIAILEE